MKKFLFDVMSMLAGAIFATVLFCIGYSTGYRECGEFFETKVLNMEAKYEAAVQTSKDTEDIIHKIYKTEIFQQSPIGKK